LLVGGISVVSHVSSHPSIRPSSPAPVHATIFGRLEERRKHRALQQERARLEALKHAQKKFDDFERQISLLQRPEIVLTGECRRERIDEEGGGEAKDLLCAGFPEPVVNAQIQRDRCLCVCVCLSVCLCVQPCEYASADSRDTHTCPNTCPHSIPHVHLHTP
jgi:hypothetical protein